MTVSRIAFASLFALIFAWALLPASAQDAPPSGASSCSGCHPPSPIADIPVPPLNGRAAGDIATALRAYRTGERSPTVMDRIAKGFSDDEIAALAAWFAAQR